MKHIMKIGLIVIVMGIVACAGIQKIVTFPWFSLETMDKVIEIVKLLSPSQELNDESLTAIGEQYGVDIKTPVNQYFIATANLKVALKDLQAAMATREIYRNETERFLYFKLKDLAKEK